MRNARPKTGGDRDAPEEIWRQPVPGAVWALNISGDDSRRFLRTVAGKRVLFLDTCSTRARCGRRPGGGWVSRRRSLLECAPTVHSNDLAGDVVGIAN